MYLNSNQENATGPYTQKYTLTWATHCDGEIECRDGSDEEGCKSLAPLYVVIFSVPVFFLLHCSLLFHSYKSSVDFMEDLTNNVVSDGRCNKEESFSISILTEKENVDQIRKIFNSKEKVIGNEGRTMCYFKVS